MPDVLIPGEQAGPVIVEQRALNEVTGKEEYYVRVKIRKSDMQNGLVSFKVPVLAVDATGKMLTDVEGLLPARFTELSTTNEFVTMVKGKAYLNVTLNPSDFLEGARTLDPTKMTYFGSNTDCTAGVGTLATAFKGFIEGCKTDPIPTSYEFPTQNAPTNINAMPAYLQKFRPIYGHTHIKWNQTTFEASEELRQVLDQHQRNTLEAIDLLIPILLEQHIKEYFEAVDKLSDAEKSLMIFD